MENFKINYNQNKIISKLPNSFIHKQTIKTSNGLVGNQTKFKLIEPIYIDLTPEDIVQTFLYLFNSGQGKGIFVNIINSKIKNWIIFCNELKTSITKYEIEICKLLFKQLENTIIKQKFNLMFFINLSNYPVLHKAIFTEQNKHMVPVVSFGSSYIHYDIVLPLPKIISWQTKPTKGILFIFEKRKIDSIESNQSQQIISKIREFKFNPYYKEINLDYVILDGINFDHKKIKLLSTLVIISDPYVPIYFQYFLNSGSQIVLIENINHYTYYSKLLMPSHEYTKWSINTWNEELDNYIEKKVIKNNLEKFSETFLNKKKFLEKIYGFLEHLNMNYANSPVSVNPFNSNDINLLTTTQLDYEKFFTLLYSNYKLIHNWSYRLTPYALLLNKLKTNHKFVPEFIKLSINSLGFFENLHWISFYRANIDLLPLILKKNKLKNIFSYNITNSNDLLNLNIVNNINSVYFIELKDKTIPMIQWENQFISDFEAVIQFIKTLPVGHSVIIKIYTFHSAQTISLLQSFQNIYEQVKVIKNNYFDSFMPYRYIVGINYNPLIKNKKTFINFEEVNNKYYLYETQELIKVVKYVKSDAVVNIEIFKNYDLVNDWTNKWLTLGLDLI